MKGASYFAVKPKVTLYATASDKIPIDTILQSEEAGTATGEVIINQNGKYIQLIRTGLKDFFYGKVGEIAINGDTSIVDDSVLLAEAKITPKQKKDKPFNWKPWAIGGVIFTTIVIVIIALKHK